MSKTTKNISALFISVAAITLGYALWYSISTFLYVPIDVRVVVHPEVEESVDVTVVRDRRTHRIIITEPQDVCGHASFGETSVEKHASGIFTLVIIEKAKQGWRFRYPKKYKGEYSFIQPALYSEVKSPSTDIYYSSIDKGSLPLSRDILVHDLVVVYSITGTQDLYAFEISGKSLHVREIKCSALATYIEIPNNRPLNSFAYSSELFSFLNTVALEEK
ncbi:hypothetical protein [Lacunimicrobium album]